MNAELLREIDARGHVHLRGAIEPARIDALERALKQLETARELPGSLARIWPPVIEECSLIAIVEGGTCVEELVDHPAILEWVRALVPAPQRMNLSTSITRGRGVGLPLHRIDFANYRSTSAGPRCDQLTAAVFLSDVGPEDGPMVVFEGSHRGDAPFPYSRVHPAWRFPAHDAEFVRRFLAEQAPGQTVVPWEEIPGYRELHVRRGDLVVFVESLWHGAREVRSSRVRRSLYYSYAPYHFANWHGVRYSEALLTRATPARRELLAGPFVGSRFPSIPTPGIPERPEFLRVPDSELGARPIGGA